MFLDLSWSDWCCPLHVAEMAGSSIIAGLQHKTLVVWLDWILFVALLEVADLRIEVVLVAHKELLSLEDKMVLCHEYI